MRVTDMSKIRKKKCNLQSIYVWLVRKGKQAGCHQRPDRSFFYKGYQFPICARCTGVIVGHILAIPCCCLWGVNYKVSISLLVIMLLDWLLQYTGRCESTNVRRLLTGICGGYGVLTLQFLCIESVLYCIL